MNALCTQDGLVVQPLKGTLFLPSFIVTRSVKEGIGQRLLLDMYSLLVCVRKKEQWEVVTSFYTVAFYIYFLLRLFW